MYLIGVTEGKIESLKKEGKMRIHLHNTLCLPQRCTQNLKTLAPIGAEKSVTETFIGEKEKWTNKGTDKLLFFCYTIQLITIKLCTKFQNPNSSSCWEIFDRKKSLQTNKQTNKQTNIITEKAKTIYSYILPTEGKIITEKAKTIYPYILRTGDIII